MKCASLGCRHRVLADSGNMEVLRHRWPLVLLERAFAVSLVAVRLVDP